ncbi:pentatricopeptide repeat-containing protein At1g31430-like [Macadamia integrifolia]|uniref:pentatricopeptide repeat-containing protein At1g31430-like n=1 Tax=Macadamia integrifolia TaxID=60698 RepID=UPI001C4F4941|nr:pentatricopeptide repeat-containing protein At1g31430-like [Macadamia integrifolia]
MFLRSSFLLFNFISHRSLSRPHLFFSSSTRKTTRLTKQECLLYLLNCKSMKDLKQIQSQMFRAGFHQNRDALNKLMVFCTDPDSGNLQYAERIFNYILEPSLFLYNLIIKAFAKKGNFKKAVLLFSGLRENGLSPDNFTYPFVLKAIGCLREFIEGRKVHGFIVKTGLEFDSFVRNSLMDMYFELGYTETLQQLFEEMTERDVVTWNVLISGYVRSGRFENALFLFRRMNWETSDRPDQATVVSTLSACVALGYLELGKEIHGYICKELEFSTIIGNALVDMYSKCGSLSLARRIFDEMPITNVITWTSMASGYVNCGQLDDARDLFERVPTRDVVLWTAMMNGYVQFNRFDEALALFREMQIKRVKPDRFTLVALLTGCAQSGALEQGKWIHGHIEENMIRIDAVLGTALIDMYAKCGCIEKSLEIFESVKERDNASWTAIICGLAMNGLTSKALELFSEMKSAGAKPDAITFIGVLSACSHGGLVEEGRCYFDSMRKEHQMEPKTEHYGCMVDLFGRAGLLDEAEKLIETIPNDKFEITVPLWGALLSACRIHGKVGRGECVAKRLVGVESSNSGVHTLLANMYAAADRWEDVTKVRRKMKELGVKKVPGCSSIEVNGIVHEFLVGDKSHPEMSEIYSMLTDLAKPLSGLEENVIERENMIPVT